jgi:small-conductance mechanosensitive channel
MPDWIQFVGPHRALQVFGVKLVGINAENGKKAIFSIVFVALVLVLNALLKRLAGVLFRGPHHRTAFWIRQGVHVLTALVLSVGLASIWFDQPDRLATALALVTAGVAFALQRVITALAGYLVILRGKTFNVGDRIVMGGVRGDVVALGFIQTTILEMGQPPSVEPGADPAMWVRARQFTGRIVTVSNDKVFDTPVYNYTRDFPYLWEEMALPIAYKADRARAEKILLDAANRHSLSLHGISDVDVQELERRYAIARADLGPRVYFRMTDNWLELTVRFLASAHGVREVKDAMTRQILAALDEANMVVASESLEIVGVPEINVRAAQDSSRRMRAS